jgi:hypothetical protein
VTTFYDLSVEATVTNLEEAINESQSIYLILRCGDAGSRDVASGAADIFTLHFIQAQSYYYF